MKVGIWALSLVISSSVFAGGQRNLGKMVYMVESAKEKQIWIADDNGKNGKPLTSGNALHLYPDIDPAATIAVYVQGTDEKTTDIYLKDLLTGEEGPMTSGEGQKLHPDLAGNGRVLAYSAPYGEKKIPQIHVMTLSRTGKARETTVVETGIPSYFPALNSDGSVVIFQQNEGTGKQVVSYDLSTQKSKVISDPKIKSMSPSISFDDRTVAFTGYVNNNWEVFLTELSTGKITQVTKNCDQDLAPTFRSDGALVFSSDRKNKKLDFYVIEAADLEKKSFVAKTLLATTANVYAPSFSGSLKINQKLLSEVPEPARSSFGAVRAGNKIVLVGGHQGEEHTYPEESFSSQVDVYDIDEGVWKEGAPRPHPAHGFGLAAYGKYVYAFGGFAFSADYTPKWHSLADIDRYDTETNEWVTVGQMPRRRSSNVVAVVGTKVYLIGGWDSTPKFPKDFDGVFHKEIDVFDLETEQMSTLEVPLANPLRRALSGVVANDKIILVGGISEGATHFNLIDNVTAFDTKTLKFEELPKLPFATFAPAAGFLDGKLWVFGGMYRLSKEDFVYVNHIYEYSLVRNATWKHSGRYLYESKGFSQVVPLNDGQLGILGGHSYEGNNAPVDTFELFELK